MIDLNKYIHECIKDANTPAWYNAKDIFMSASRMQIIMWWIFNPVRGIGVDHNPF